MILLAMLVLAASPPDVIALPPKPAPGLDGDGGTAGPPLPDRPMHFPFKRVVFNTRDTVVTDDYLAVLTPVPGGGLKGDFRFASGQPADRFWIELSPTALKEAHTLLTVQQGNDHLREKGTRLEAGKGFLRASRLEATSFPFLASQRLLVESASGAIGPLSVGLDRVPGLKRNGTEPFRLKVRGKALNLVAERYISTDPRENVELLLVRSIPGIGEVDLILSVNTRNLESVVLSLD